MQFAFPTRNLRIEEREGQQKVWDPLRRKWYVLQPEEFVRQQLLQHLIEDRGVSTALISVEKEIPYLSLRKRFDVVVFDSNGKALILIECKAPDIKLGQDTLHQIARYNREIGAPHLLITNGVSLLFFSQNEQGKYVHQKSGWMR